MSGLEEVYAEWQNNAHFREAFKKDPKKALAEAGFMLNDNDLQNILKLKDQNQKLDDRISK